MKTVYNKCALEIDAKRGVLYVHSKKGKTIVRIQGLTQAQCEAEGSGMIDVNFNELFGGFTPATDPRGKLPKRVQEVLERVKEKPSAPVQKVHLKIKEGPDQALPADAEKSAKFRHQTVLHNEPSPPQPGRPRALARK